MLWRQAIGCFRCKSTLGGRHRLQDPSVSDASESPVASYNFSLCNRMVLNRCPYHDSGYSHTSLLVVTFWHMTRASFFLSFEPRWGWPLSARRRNVTWQRLLAVEPLLPTCLALSNGKCVDRVDMYWPNFKPAWMGLNCFQVKQNPHIPVLFPSKLRHAWHGAAWQTGFYQEIYVQHVLTWWCWTFSVSILNGKIKSG